MNFVILEMAAPAGGRAAVTWGAQTLTAPGVLRLAHAAGRG
jgi:hypothetical protein